MKVSKSFFRNIFNTKFNIGFKSPVSDVCSICLSLDEKIKLETDKGRRSDLLIQKRVHKVRARAYFDLLKEEDDDVATISFDCQKNMVLPKVQDQAAYYSRQLYMYDFTVKWSWRYLDQHVGDQHDAASISTAEDVKNLNYSNLT